MDKKLGRGLEDISHFFIDTASSAVDIARDDAKKTVPPASITRFLYILSSKERILHNTFLTCNLAVTLSRLGMRIAIVDANPGLPCHKFFLGEEANGKICGQDSGSITSDGPLGIKLIPFTKEILESFSKNPAKISQSIDRDLDLILLCVSDDGSIIPGINEIDMEFLLIVPAKTKEIIHAYQMAKTIFHKNKNAQLGLVIEGADEEFKADAIFAKMAEMISRYLNKEVLRFGNIYYKKDLDPGTGPRTNFISMYDAELQAAISNIAQIIILRMNVAAGVENPNMFFERLFKVVMK